MFDSSQSIVLACLLLAPLGALACSGADTSTVAVAADGDVIALTPAVAGSDTAQVSNRAIHLTMRDGVRIAVDVWLPAAAARGEQLPSIVRATRYWRDVEIVNREAMPETDREAMARSFVDAGYAYLAIDARGTGASFGVTRQPWSPSEVEDYGEVLDWLVQQPWSNGRVGSFGISYDSNTAEMMATLGNGRVQALVPRFGYPNVYSDVIFPGGIFNREFMQAWLGRSIVMDGNDLCTLAGAAGTDCDGLLSIQTGVKRVDADSDGALLDAAIAEHASAPDEFALVSGLSGSDELWDGASFAELSPGLQGPLAPTTSVMAWASWMDLGTARGALNRWASSDAPMVLYIGPWNHDASQDANPYLPPDAPLEMGAEEQRAMEVSFFDQHLKGSSEPAARSIHYFTLGENVWKQTSEWPPPGTRTQPLYLRAAGVLSSSPAAAAEPADLYAVDFSASTGPTNGWWTKLTGDDVQHADRRTEDGKLLAYTSAPLGTDLEITGHPQVTLHLSSTESDGAVFVYLEDVAPDGAVTYLTEGELRLLHRKPCSDPPAVDEYGPCHSFRLEDAEPMPIGVSQEVTLGLHPISVQVQAGHSLRVALAGHDASSFARIPSVATPIWSVAHDPQHPSRIDLPIARAAD